MKALLKTAIFTTFLLCPVFSQAGYFGVTIHHYKGNVARHENGTYGMKTIRRTVLAVYPQPGPQGMFIGVDSAPLIPLLQTQGEAGLSQVSHYFMDIIQNAYFKIAEDRGLLKMGSAFQKDLATSEPFWDGRSAAIALFEGDDFSKPLATFRVSYSTPEHPNLPFEGRLKINLKDLKEDDPEEEVPPQQIGRVLGLDLIGKNMVNKVTELAEKSRDWQGLLFAQIMKMAAPGIPTNHKFLIGTGQVIPFEKVMEAAIKQLGRPLMVGGHGAELKGLSLARNDQRTDYMFFLFNQAVERGFFDVIPYVNGYLVPKSFSGETTIGHVENQYKDWNWTVLRTLHDPTINKEVAVVRFQREDFAKLLPMYFNRATASGLFDLADKEINREDFFELIGKSEAQTLVIDPQFPLHRVTSEEINLHHCMTSLNFATKSPFQEDIPR